MSTKPTSETQNEAPAPLAQPEQETQDRTICFRSVKTSCLLGLAVLGLCFASGHSNWGWGFLIGGVLSLFSMLTLMFAVPFLTWSGAPRHMSALLIVTLYMKLPIFCFGLYLATHTPGISAFACFLGICLAPTAITLKAIGNILEESVAAYTPRASATAPKTLVAEPAKTETKARPVRTPSTEFVREQV